MPYTEHPSPILKALFREKSWQGANPMQAKYVFVGLDANFAIDVETQIPQIISYLQDGPQFWTNTERHHPFMLDGYNGDGVLYHRNFKLIGFTPAEACQVSFIELVEKPTTGRSRLTFGDLSLNHMNWIRDIIDNGNAKYILIPPQAIKLMKRKEVFSWLRRRRPIRIEGNFKVWRDDAERGQIIYEMYHLSNYGKHYATLKLQIEQLSELVILERQ